MKYVVDSSLIIRRSKQDVYEFESFPTQWSNLDKMIKEGSIIAPIEVRKELLKTTNELEYWCNNHERMFIPPNNDIILELSFLEEKFLIWYHSKDDSKDWADPYLIAYAKAYDAVLVTQEGWYPDRKEKNYSIPIVCSKLGAYCHIGQYSTKNVNRTASFQCIDFIELIKRESLYES
ncbi:MAG: DUF4411 family protein [Methanobrevibacter sp.]|nr:DUF4411 family protein [Methanobrevibacter sp.]